MCLSGTIYPGLRGCNHEREKNGRKGLLAYANILPRPGKTCYASGQIYRNSGAAGKREFRERVVTLKKNATTPARRLAGQPRAAAKALSFCCCLALALLCALCAQAGVTGERGRETNPAAARQVARKPATTPIKVAQPSVRPATMPVKVAQPVGGPPTGPAKVAQPGGQSGQAGAKPAAVKAPEQAGRGTEQGATAARRFSKGGIKGFSSNPFALEHRKKPAAPQTRQNGTTQKAATSSNGTDKNSRLVFSGGRPERAEDRLSPRRSAFSGGPDTMARMEEPDPAPEMNMTYKMNKQASTRVTLNQQDENSPLYLPGGKSDSINGAGVYMDVDVKKDLQLRFGGEYQEVEGSHGSQEERAQGASVGLRWSF